jgi:hypothetical protein
VIATYPGNGTSTSQVQRFTTIAAPPQLATPAHQERCVDLSPVFHWSSVPNFQTYWLQISSSSDFQTVLYDNTQLDTNYLTINLSQHYATFYWRVKALFAGCQTAWSQVSEFTTLPQTPLVTSPPNNEKGVALNASITWNAVGGATSYTLQVADNPEFTDPVVNEIAITNTYFGLSLTDYNKTFYWRVRSNYPDCSSNWSIPRNFKTVYPSVSLATPANDENCVPIKTTLSWQIVPNAYSYRIQIAESNNFDQGTVVNTTMAEVFYNASFAKDLQDYYWRVRADDTTNFGVWSETRHLRTTVFAPAIQSPVDSSTGNPVNITLKWLQKYTNSFYSLKLSKYPDMSQPLVDTSNLAATQLTVNNLEYDSYYYWQLKVVYTGCVSAWSPVYRFKTVLNIPVLNKPENNATSQPLTILFEWKEVTDAQTYEISIAEDAAFTKVKGGKKGLLTTKASFNFFEPLKDYYWRVRAANADGTGDWSAPWKLTTGPQGAPSPMLVSPKNNTTKVAIPVELVWSKSVGAEAYYLQIADNESFMGLLITDDNSLTDTSFSLSGVENYKYYYWRVAAVNDSGTSRWSDIWRFRTIAQIPTDKPQLTSPPDNTEEVDSKVLLAWGNAERATSHNVQVSTKNDFSEVYIEKSTIDNQQLIDGLKADTRYYWRVKGTNEGGEGPWSDPFTFKTRLKVSVIDENKSIFHPDIYPNPAANSATLKLNLPHSGYLSLHIADGLGIQEQSVLNLPCNSGSNEIRLDLGNKASGIYSLIIDVNGIREVISFVVVK